jgi:hypothetical protein
LFGDEGVVKLFGILRSIEGHARVSQVPAAISGAPLPQSVKRIFQR